MMHSEVKSYKGNGDVVRLMDQAIELACMYEHYTDCMSKWCCLNQWHGLKRHNRILSKKFRCHRLKLEFHTIDQFGQMVNLSWSHSIPTPKDLTDYCDICLDWATKTYVDFCKVANDLTIKNYCCEASMVRDIASCLSKEVERLRRIVQDGNACSWDYSHMRIMDMKRHDACKSIEED